MEEENMRHRLVLNIEESRVVTGDDQSVVIIKSA